MILLIRNHMKDCLHIVMLYRRQMMLVGKVLTDHFFVKSFIGFVFQCNALLIKFIEKLVQIGLLISFQLLLMRSFVQLCEIKTIYDNFDLISSIHMLFPFLCVSVFLIYRHWYTIFRKLSYLEQSLLFSARSWNRKARIFYYA